MSDTHFKFTDTALRSVGKYIRRCCGMEAAAKIVRLVQQRGIIVYGTIH